MKIWKYISLFFAGIIAGLVVAFKLQPPQTEITNNTEIGKVKQKKGSGATQTVTQSPDQSTAVGTSRKAQRQAKRARKREQRSKASEDEEV